MGGWDIPDNHTLTKAFAETRQSSDRQRAAVPNTCVSPQASVGSETLRCFHGSVTAVTLTFALGQTGQRLNLGLNAMVVLLKLKQHSIDL